MPYFLFVTFFENVTDLMKPVICPISFLQLHLLKNMIPVRPSVFIYGAHEPFMRREIYDQVSYHYHQKLLHSLYPSVFMFPATNLRKIQKICLKNLHDAQDRGGKTPIFPGLSLLWIQRVMYLYLLALSLSDQDLGT